MRITLLDKDFHLGIGFLSELIEGTGLKMEELGSQDSAVLVPKLMFYSHSYACKRNGKDFTFKSIEDVFDLIDENGGMLGDFFTKFSIAFAESMSKDVPVDNSKKKAEAQK